MAISQFVSSILNPSFLISRLQAHSSQKFLPQLSAQSFQKLASVSDLIAAKFRTVADVIYSDPHSSLGLPDSHNGIISNYYPGFRDLDKDQLSHIQDALNSASIASENTRLSRVVQASGAEELSLLVASADKDTTSLNGTSPSITLEFGDHSSELTRVISSLQEAIHYSATQEEKLAITSYIKSFQTGSIFAHKKALGHWVKDRSPVVETLLGFIEYYRDPASVRAEWRGFVMIKNKAESEVFARLAAQANKFLALLPWSRDFEEREFMTPDFTSMEALTLVSTTMPAGTSGPNYEDVKRECGFKNISIRNRVVESSSADITFLEAEDKALYARYAVDGFGVIVAFHELIGHGSGKCFTETSDGQYNFDRDNPPINPLNGQAVKTWYKKGQTAKSIFGSSYEECRAECIALYLALQSEAMELFTYADVEKDDGKLACRYCADGHSHVSSGLCWVSIHPQSRSTWLKDLESNAEG